MIRYYKLLFYKYEQKTVELFETSMSRVHFLVVLLPSIVYGDYDCICNYNVEKAVLPSPQVNAPPLGYMYEFDCKPKFNVLTQSDFYAIQFEKQLGYVAVDQQVKIQTCPGSPSIEDLIHPTTTTEVTTIALTPRETTSTPQQTTTTTIPQTTTTTTTTTTATTPTTTTTPTTIHQHTTTTTEPVPTTTTSSIPTTKSPTTPTTTTTRTTEPISTITVTIPQTSTTTTPIPTTIMTTLKPTNTITPSTTTSTETTSTQATTKFLSTSSSSRYDWLLAVNVNGTPFQYVGVGYNLLTENPETGFHTTHRILQLTGTSNNVHEAIYSNNSSCTSHKSTVLLHGSKAYQDELKTLVRPSSSHTDQLLKEAFTYNTQFTSVQQVIDGSTNLYLDVITTCNYGTVRYITENASQGQFAVTREFARDVCSLPKDMTTSAIAQYMHFLDNWGTSIVTRVDLGTKLLERYTTNASDVFQHVQQTDTNLLELRGAFRGFSSSVTINTHDFGNSPVAEKPFGTMKAVDIGTPHQQVPIGADVIPIVDALDKMYWKTILGQLVAEGICHDTIYGTDLDIYKTNFQMALSQYVGYKGNTGPHREPLDRHIIQVPITWPYGTYGLMKTASGCPLNNVHWYDGYRKQYTETTNGHNEYSVDISTYMAGDFHSADLTTHFCMKTSTHSSNGSQFDQQWPKGAFCVLKKGTCPTGFSEGYVLWDDENDIFSNSNSRGGALPDGAYNDNTKIYYCCRNDGSPVNKILLPTDRPFILIRYGSICQAVHGMTVHELYIRWDDENTSNKDALGGIHPVDDGGSGNHKLHFCFYQVPGGPVFVGKRSND